MLAVLAAVLRSLAVRLLDTVGLLLAVLDAVVAAAAAATATAPGLVGVDGGLDADPGELVAVVADVTPIIASTVVIPVEMSSVAVFPVPL